jgi:hypothetical protein
MSTTINGITVTDLTYKNPGNSLPKFVREAAEERGYGDSTQTLSLFVQEGDIAEAFACAAQGNGSSCVMAQAGTRIGAKAVYFYRNSAWIDFGSGPIVRFATSRAIYNNVIVPFDEGDRERVKPGIYHLTPVVPSYRLAKKREDAQKQVKGERSKPNGTRRAIMQAHTERVVMAAHV